jgi:hypothetical protein
MKFPYHRTTVLRLGVLWMALCASAAPARLSQEPAGKMWPLAGPEGGAPRIQIIENLTRLDPPKISPKHKWLFEWTCGGVGRINTTDPQYQLRIRVFAQQKKEENDPAPMVTRMAMRLWDYNAKRFNLQHKEMYDDGRVHFYLCFGGPAGGEQLFDEDEEGGRARRVNTIYIYQIQNIKEPIELAREVAHEYGHATLPPVGGFKEPEDWGNGHLGEKLYLKLLYEDVKAKRLQPADAAGASLADLEAFVKREVEPLAAKVGLEGPDMSYLVGTGQKAMDAYAGLAIYAHDILPPKAFSRSLLLTGSVKASDYPAAIVMAASELDTFAIVTPPYLKGKDIWIPLGKGRLNGLTPLKRQGDWALVRPATDIVRVINR